MYNETSPVASSLTLTVIIKSSSTIIGLRLIAVLESYFATFTGAVSL